MNSDAGGVARLVEIEAFEDRGLGEVINSELDTIVNGFDGVIFNESDRIDQSITDYEEQMDVIEERALNTKLRLQRQFDAMEVAISQLQSQSAAFAGMLPS